MGPVQLRGDLVWRGLNAYAGNWLVGEVVFYDRCQGTGRPGWVGFLFERSHGCHATEADAKAAVDRVWQDRLLELRIADLDAGE